ncbi:MAG: hypothetical protein ABII13_00455 [Patescibacteria group bacterium]|nr:hypothetical protein [Patescibacteria group bacterium]MBU2509493.1 hypothetical protein [Patescibacteria group bacterium]
MSEPTTQRSPESQPSGSGLGDEEKKLDKNQVHLLIKGDKPGRSAPVWRWERRTLQRALFNIQAAVNSGEVILDSLESVKTPDGVVWKFKFSPNKKT